MNKRQRKKFVNRRYVVIGRTNILHWYAIGEIIRPTGNYHELYGTPEYVNADGHEQYMHIKDLKRVYAKKTDSPAS